MLAGVERDPQTVVPGSADAGRPHSLLQKCDEVGRRRAPDVPAVHPLHETVSKESSARRLVDADSAQV
ncbi:hypothetical protein BCONGLO52_02750 [Brachybacterium conglomeratum]|uniref:Uncharacterized protein n=1 Tax=Brachybacterium conglomeratum TaxID=47846 RepID=A0ABQ5RC17_9MICO|nr:hypothetical protein BCONGLO52_02750 [Brachybacterium conglomeratum]